MRIESFSMGAKGKLAQAVNYFDMFLDYWKSAKGTEPESLTVTKEVYKHIIEKADNYCNKNKIIWDGVLTYSGILVKPL